MALRRRLAILSAVSRENVDIVRRGYEAWEESDFETLLWEVRDLVAGGGNVVPARHLDRAVRTGGTQVENDLWVVWRVKNGQICQVSFFYREREALDAAGLHRWPDA